MSYEGQRHHPHRRGYPPSVDRLLDSQASIPPSLQLVQAHWFVRHGERAPVRQRMVGLGEIPAVYELCSVARNFTSAVLSLSPSTTGLQTPSQLSASSLRSSPTPSNPFLASSRHTTSASRPTHDTVSSPLAPAARDLAVTRFTEDISPAKEATIPLRGGLSDCYWGELTDLGRESTLRFGAALRHLYTSPSSTSHESFLPSTLDARALEEGIVQFRSTNMPRTIESLHQIVHGLYPSTFTDGGAGGGSSPPLRVPYRVRNWMDENLYPNTACKRLRQLDALSIASAAEKYNPDLSALDAQLVPVLGKPLRIDSSPRANGVLDTLMVCRAHGIKVPRVFEDRNVLETLERGVVHEWFDGYLNPEFRRLAMGRLFSDLHSHLSSKIFNPTSDRLKLAINSCHDTSIGGILNALEAFNGRWPPFTSNLGIELYRQRDDADPTQTSSAEKKQGEEHDSIPSRLSSALHPSSLSAKKRPNHFVRVLFNGEPLLLPGCKRVGDHLEGSRGQVCTWEAFEKVLNDTKIGEAEWRQACGSE